MRLGSLDVFRGLTMAGMVIVNNPGDWATVYAPLLHAEWHGWTPTDLIFPWFLFIMGASLAQADRARTTVLAVGRRGATLVALGLWLSGYPAFDPARWRIPGVLFRLGLCYVAAALVWRTLQPAAGRAGPAEGARAGAMTGGAGAGAGATVRHVLVVAATCLLGYWALLALVAPPGGTAGDLTPDGNLGAWLDRAVFGTHLWKRTWDPEGLLSTLPAVGTTLFGVAAGAWIRAWRPASAPWLVAAGGGALVTGLAWGAVLPINKALWTSSYALFTAGTAAVVLGLLHRVLDDGRAPAALARLSAPLVALGRNALLLFVVSGVVAKTLLVWRVGEGAAAVTAQHWIYQRAFAPWAAPKVASLAYAAANLAGWYLLLAWLDRRRWYWSV